MKDKLESFHDLVRLMDTLRDPGGCPWDREQTRETLKPFLLEEAYEVLEALDADDPQALCEELGDLLLQVVFHGRIAQERGEFDIYDVCKKVLQKMIRRHPHVFGEARYRDSEDVLRNWEDIKNSEKEEDGEKRVRRSLLDGIPARLPAVYRANQLSAKAARMGFDWPDVDSIREKLLEEFDELTDAIAEGDVGRIRDEVGDLLFTVLNVARKAKVDPETALVRSNEKFEKRFKMMERRFGEAGRSLKEVPVEEMERMWSQLKRSSDPESDSDCSQPPPRAGEAKA